MKLFKFLKLILFVIITCVLTISCGGNMENNASKGIELLGRSDCLHTPTMEKNFVSALEIIGLDKKYKYIDLGSLPKNDYRRGYGTPTILINGEDLFGMPKPKPITTAPTWRLYSGGVPSAESIAKELAKLNSR